MTLILTANGALMTVFSDNFWYVVPAFVTGVFADGLAHRMRSLDLIRRVRVLSFAVPTVWYGLYLVTLALVAGGLEWSIHMTLGGPLLAGAAGLLLGLVVFPRQVESEPMTEP